MIADTSPEPLTLAEILTSVARRATDGQLLAMTLVGLGGTVVIEALLGRKGWLGAAGALAVGAYGAWGIADRELNELWSRPGSPRAKVLPLQLLRALAAMTATLSAVALLAAVFIPMLGLWRS
ncbi:MAG: hypothetical protein U9Q74_00030 [Gemmatimonadota bacterium]|nr:hypothetical protein [Gemmatimonadota bacterium]